MDQCVNEIVKVPSIPILSPITEKSTSVLIMSGNFPFSGYVRLYKNGYYQESFQFENSLNLPFSILPLPGEVYTVRFWREGFLESDPSNQVQVSGVKETYTQDTFLDYEFPILFTDLEESGYTWYKSVIDKLFVGGTVPSYINTESQDSKDFWTSVAKFFEYYVVISRYFSSFELSRELLVEFLLERNLFLRGDENLRSLQEIRKQYYSYITSRGSIVQLQDREKSEIFKIIASYSFDYLGWKLFKEGEVGWSIGLSSPLFRGISNKQSLNLFPYNESSDQLGFDLNPLLPQSNPQNLSEQLDEGVKVLRMNSPSGVSSNREFQELYPYLLRISDNIDYEFSLKVKKSSLGRLSIGIRLFSQEGQELTPFSSSTYQNTNWFLYQEKLQRSDRYITIRGFIYGFKKQPRDKDSLNIKKGNNLISSPGATYLLPQILIENDSNGSLGNALVKEVKIAPISTPFSRGFVQTRNLLSLWLMNRSDATIDQIEANFVKYLLPYNLHLVTVESSQDKISSSTDEDCNCEQSPIWIDTGRTKCIGRDSYKEQIDTNICTQEGTKWILTMVQNLKDCPECVSDNLFSHSVDQYQDCLFPYIYDGKKFSKKTTIYLHDGRCGVKVGSISYSEPCEGEVCETRSTLPSWEPEGEIFCTEDDCPNGVEPLYRRTGKILCKETLDETTIPPVKWLVDFESTVCLETAGTTTQPQTTIPTTIPCRLIIDSIINFNQSIPSALRIFLSGYLNGPRDYSITIKVNSTSQTVWTGDSNDNTVGYIDFNGLDIGLSPNVGYLVEVYDKEYSICVGSKTFSFSPTTTTTQPITTTQVPCRLSLVSVTNPLANRDPADLDYFVMKISGMYSGRREYRLQFVDTTTLQVVKDRTTGVLDPGYSEIGFRASYDGLTVGKAYNIIITDTEYPSCPLNVQVVIRPNPIQTTTAPQTTQPVTTIPQTTTRPQTTQPQTTNPQTTQPQTTLPPPGCQKPGLSEWYLVSPGYNVAYPSVVDACDRACNGDTGFTYYTSSTQLGGIVYLTGNNDLNNCFHPVNGFYVSQSNVIHIVDGRIYALYDHCFCNEKPVLSPTSIDVTAGGNFNINVSYQCTTVGVKFYRNGVFFDEIGTGQKVLTFNASSVNNNDKITASTNCGQFESARSNEVTIIKTTSGGSGCEKSGPFTSYNSRRDTGGVPYQSCLQAIDRYCSGNATGFPFVIEGGVTNGSRVWNSSNLSSCLTIPNGFYILLDNNLQPFRIIQVLDGKIVQVCNFNPCSTPTYYNHSIWIERRYVTNGVYTSVPFKDYADLEDAFLYGNSAQRFPNGNGIGGAVLRSKDEVLKMGSELVGLSTGWYYQSKLTTPATPPQKARYDTTIIFRTNGGTIVEVKPNLTAYI